MATISINVPFHEMTVKDLRMLVSYADKAEAPDETSVFLAYEDDDYHAPIGLELILSEENFSKQPPDVADS